LGTKLPAGTRNDLLANIEEETTRLSRFVTDLLDMTKLEAGAIEAVHERLDVLELVSSAARRVRKAWPGRMIEIQAEANLPVVAGDRVLLEQMIFNLLENAQLYSAPSTPTRITIKAAPLTVDIIVEDQGIGIPPEELERIFEKFHRIGKGDGRPIGTGLGLAICRAIASAMKGTIRAESPGSSGSGSRFVVTLPVVSPP
jgi:two-component system sensor histidine kinase KdpD